MNRHLEEGFVLAALSGNGITCVILAALFVMVLVDKAF